MTKKNKAKSQDVLSNYIAVTALEEREWPAVGERW